MFKKVLILGVIAAALGVAPAVQAAPFLVGGISYTSVGVGPGLSPVLPIDAGGLVLNSFISAVALDFTKTGAATPGVEGGFSVNATSGSFNTLWGATGLMKDFSFKGPGMVGYPTVPIGAFQTIPGPMAFSFDLLTVHVFGVQTATALTLQGTGLFHMDGFADTPGTFTFTTNQGGDTFSFSASEAVVPEPGSMLLLGTGLFGLAGLLRYRRQK
ncbi:MAG TPA: PEP-CTERM sorting domain-containing protein [Gemmatimonadales bacterium]